MLHSSVDGTDHPCRTQSNQVKANEAATPEPGASLERLMTYTRLLSHNNPSLPLHALRYKDRAIDLVTCDALFKERSDTTQGRALPLTAATRIPHYLVSKMSFLAATSLISDLIALHSDCLR